VDLTSQFHPGVINLETGDQKGGYQEMKNLIRYLLIATILLLALAPTPVLAQDPTPQPENLISGDQLVIGNTFSLRENESLDGNMLILGGIASTAYGSNVSGDIVLVGGTLSIDGNVNGDIVSIGGSVNLGDNAIVNGDLSILGGTLQRSNLAIINGGINQNAPGTFDFNFPGSKNNWWPFNTGRSLVTRVLNAVFQSLAIGILAVLIGLLLPHNIKNIASTIKREPLVSGGIGLLTIVVVPIVLLLLIITILLIPVSVLGFIALSLAVLLGFIAVGFEIGQRMAELVKTSWHPSISAGLGTLLLALVTSSANLIPCVGWILGFVASIIGLGAVITSRVGSEKYADRLIQAVSPATDEIPSPITGQPTEKKSDETHPEPPQAQ
jgi:hypothetical protein